MTMMTEGGALLLVLVLTASTAHLGFYLLAGLLVVVVLEDGE